MTTYVLDDPKKGRIQYRDKKRWLWFGAILFSLMPLPIIAAFTWSENPWVLILPLEISFILIPIIDHFVGVDTNNPPEEIVPQLDADPYYHRLLLLAVPVHFITIFAGAWLVGTHPLPVGFLIAFAIVMGLYSGMSINTAHEIGHKNTKRERLLSRFALAVTGYGHFCSDHNMGHHRDVSTPEDPVSARMGESIYRFMLREIPGAFKRGWEAEAARLRRRKKPVWSHHNHILQSYAITLFYQGGLVLAFGWILIPFFLIHNGFAWFQLTSANYIEHYGLLRAKKPNGRYERCQPHHSWNANHTFSNLMLFQLQRHSDHHANPARSYQSLRSFDDLPELPFGYFTMYLIAYIPALWFRIMDPILMRIPHISGDLDKVNLDPQRAEVYQQRWGDDTENLLAK